MTNGIGRKSSSAIETELGTEICGLSTSHARGNPAPSAGTRQGSGPGQKPSPSTRWVGPTRWTTADARVQRIARMRIPVRLCRRIMHRDATREGETEIRSTIRPDASSPMASLPLDVSVECSLRCRSGRHSAPRSQSLVSEQENEKPFSSPGTKSQNKESVEPLTLRLRSE